MSNALAASFALVVFCPSALCQDFEPDRPIPSVSDRNREISLADFDGDGDLDLLVVSMDPPSVGIVERLSGNRFLTPRIIAEDPVEMNSAVAIDIDGDGDLDVVTAGTEARWWRNNGDMVFGPGGLVDPIGSRYSGLRAGDLDGDGVLDLVARLGTVSLCWIPHLGGGVFAPLQIIELGAGGSSELVDADGDGDLDLIAVKVASGRCRLFENDGAGSGWAPSTLTSAFLQPSKFQVGDLDADGDLDLVAVSRVDRSLQWVENLGGGSYGPRQELAAWRGSRTPTGLELADLEGNGTLDVVVTLSGDMFFETSRVAALRNLGSATFAAEEVLGAPASRDDLGFPIAGDLEGDGNLEVLATSNRHVDLIESSAGTFGAGRSILRDVRSIYDFALADLDLDGDLDFVTAVFGGRSYDVLLSEAVDGVSEQRRLFDDLSQPWQVEVAEVNGDGFPDVVLAYEAPGFNVLSVAWMAGDGSGGFGPVQQVFSIASPTAYETRLAVADMEGDGDDDWLLVHRDSFGQPCVLRWFVSDGVGGITPGPSTSHTIGCADSISLADLDGDGDADVVLDDGDNRDSLHWRRNQGNGTFGAAIGLNVDRGGLWGVFHEVADIDGDGDIDIVATDGFRLFWLENTGAQGFVRRPDLEPDYQYIRQIRAADLDGDGDTDVVASVFGSATSRVFTNLGGGAAWAQQELPLDFTYSWDVAIADVDGDLDQDIVQLVGPARDEASLRVHYGTARFGAVYCRDAAATTAGTPAFVTARGSAALGANDLTLEVLGMSAQAFGYCLVSQQPGFAAQPGGSSGNLCLSGSIGRLNRAALGEVFQATGAGSADVSVDLANLPGPTGPLQIQPGESLYFQAWFRDGASSNFSSGLRIDFF